MRRLPAGLLAHNLAVAAIMASPAFAVKGVGGTELAAVSLRVRALWRIAAHWYDGSSVPTRVLLTLLSSEASGAAADNELAAAIQGMYPPKAGGKATMPSGPPSGGSTELACSRGLAALLLMEPQLVFIELLTIAGIPSAVQALPLAMTLALGQAIAAGTAAGQFSAQGWQRHLLASADELDAATAASTSKRAELEACASASAQLEHAFGIMSPLVARHLHTLLDVAALLLCSLRGTSPPPLSAGSFTTADEQCAAILATFDACNVTPAVAGHFILVALPRLLRAMASHAKGIWESGSPAFRFASYGSPAPLSLGLEEATKNTRHTLQSLTIGQHCGHNLWSQIGLLPLPASFEEIFHAGMGLQCELCGVHPPSRALCLACGACICGIETLHGPRACISHAGTCSEGSALFLLSNTSAVLLVREKRVMILGSPYRDAHGETDLGLMRGKPLVLDRDEYQTLSRQWIALSFSESARGEANHDW